MLTAGGSSAEIQAVQMYEAMCARIFFTTVALGRHVHDQTKLASRPTWHYGYTLWQAFERRLNGHARAFS